ncbi:hypothetical protein BCV69DRAFT_110211 [Microstroma glucosiphilum]|uniref:Uncharacterized protein n=1 Tax=Pseudomicrostroma glucosiphilum TaxID=1684307 RepID=A0A316UIW7_9BASI|nr:hypothetical protein BCV69DRAFT_110211 [Pseudomicrostroma glucosiphilum]PWN23145.1 hypothetical protein BCV69DRAFT_110211 [Pseudomicrostroma glucosiphilum]
MLAPYRGLLEGGMDAGGTGSGCIFSLRGHQNVKYFNCRQGHAPASPRLARPAAGSPCRPHRQCLLQLAGSTSTMHALSHESLEDESVEISANVESVRERLVVALHAFWQAMEKARCFLLPALAAEGKCPPAPSSLVLLCPTWPGLCSRTARSTFVQCAVSPWNGLCPGLLAQRLPDLHPKERKDRACPRGTLLPAAGTKKSEWHTGVRDRAIIC